MNAVQPREFESVEGAHAWMREQFGDWADRPTSEHLQALTSYKTVGFREINEALRSGDTTRFDDPTHLAITEAIAAEAITESVTVYRGIADPALAELVLLGATEIQHQGFVSVSLLEQVARGFTSTSALDDEDPTNVLLVGTLPIGTPAAPLDLIPSGNNDHEAELLLHAGSAFEIDTTDDFDSDLIIVHGRWRTP